MSTCSSATNRSAAPSPAVDLPRITVNGQNIDQELLSNEVQYHVADNLDEAVHKAGQALVIRQLLKQQLNGNEGSDEEAFAKLVSENVTYESVESVDCQRYYQQNLSKFQTAPILEVSHILLSAAPNDPQARIDKNQLADELIARLLEQPELFAEFAAKFSDCPSKQTGGSLGQISTGQTVVEFERQLFALPEGLHSQAIESRYGYHITLINKRVAGKQLTFDMVENQIRQYLDHRRYRQAVGDYLYRLAQDAEIDGIELKLDQENIIIN